MKCLEKRELRIAGGNARHEDPDSMRRRGLALLLLLAAATAGMIWSYRAVFPRSIEEVEAVQIRRGRLDLTIPVTGIFETRTVEVAFDIPGRLREVAVGEGEAVAAGALIAAVDREEARAAVAQAQEALHAAEREAERGARAVEAARRQADQAQAAYRTAQANAAQVRAGPREGEIRQAEAAASAARAALEEARRALERAEKLYLEGALSKAQLDSARAEVEGAEARHRQSVAQLDLLRAGTRPEAITAAEQQVRQSLAGWRGAQANVRQAEAAAGAARAGVEQARAALRAASVRLARGEVRAPFDAIVTRVYLNAGSPVGPGVPVASLAAAGGWVTAEVDEADIGQVRPGQRARITADAYPGRTLAGTVTRIARQVEVRLGTRVVRVRIDLEAGGALRVGTSVDVQLLLRTIPDVLLSPAEAVIATPNDGTAHVFLVAGDRLRQRDVRVGPGNDEFVVIEAGLREGDRVAVAESARLRDGLRVRVVTVR
jgi:HlyD family secretion protein